MKMLLRPTSIAETAQSPTEIGEHWLVRNARNFKFSFVCPLQPTLDNMFIGAVQYMGEHPKSYTMEAVSEIVEAYEKASRIAQERTSQLP